MTSWLPSTGDVVRLHAAAVAAAGGDVSPPRDGCVDGSIGSAISAAMYERDDDGEEHDPAAIAANVLFYLASNHCFTDGNKRVAWAVAVDVLLRVGLAVEATDDDAAGLVERVATHAASRGDVQAWILEPGRLIAA